MQVCTNCGASVREGARFCTTCGTRLNDAPAGTSAAGWGDSGSDETLHVPAAEASEQHDGETEADAASALTGSDFSWDWRTTSETAANDEVDEADQVSVESGEAPDTESAEPEPEDSVPVADPIEIEVLADQPEISNDPDTTSAPDDLAEIVEDTSTAEALDAVDGSEDSTLAAWAGQWSDEAEADAPGVPGDQADEPTDQQPDAGDPAARAQQIVAELQELLPRLVAASQAVPAADEPPIGGGTLPAGLLEELDAGIAGESFDDLGDVIDAARNNPRDVDSMLKLAGSADRLQELLDDRARLVGTIDSARTRLRDHLVGDDEDQGDSL